MDIDAISRLVPDVGYFNYRKPLPDWRIEETAIDFIDLSYIAGGSAVYHIDREPVTVSAGDLLCIPKGRLRSAYGAPEVFAANLQLFDPSGGEAAMPLPLVSRIGLKPDIIALYRELSGEWLRREPGYLMKTRACFLLILHRYLELTVYNSGTAQADPRIKAAIQFMTDHFAEPLTLSAAAETTGLTPAYFGTLFKQATGMTFRQYLTAIRLNQAENMLRHSGYSVNEAAQECGFSDLFYFSRVYKRVKGVPPSQVKLLYRADGP
ncbi:MAG: AraC family transcriptional regulator [Oscillospiraceae bacterium]|nr:AraC family transcriptional regulator [Oscillospiraceae bacterium]